MVASLRLDEEEQLGLQKSQGPLRIQQDFLENVS
jgi:hypothetical protein